MTKTRKERYQTVREALEHDDDCLCHLEGAVCRRCPALADLAALEAQDRDRQRLIKKAEAEDGYIVSVGGLVSALEAQEQEAPKYVSQIPEKYDPEKSYPPAPPAAECACDDKGFCPKCVDSKRPPCCEGLREELANVRYDLDEATAGQREAVRINLERSKLMEGLDAELSDAKIEIARLTAELEKEQRGHSNTVEAAGDALRRTIRRTRQSGGRADGR